MDVTFFLCMQTTLHRKSITFTQIQGGLFETHDTFNNTSYEVYVIYDLLILK